MCVLHEQVNALHRMFVELIQGTLPFVDAQAHVQRLMMDNWGTKFDRKPQSNPVWF
jgi:hypothetical protein